MVVKGEFKGLIHEFIYSWQCPSCGWCNDGISIRSPFTQIAIRCCYNCKTEYSIQLDIKAMRKEKIEMAGKLGIAALEVLIPGY